MDVHHLVPSAMAVALLVSVGAQTPSAPAPFVPGSVHVDGLSYQYLLLEPLPGLRAAEMPLVVFLHGAAQLGEDNDAQQRWLPEVLAEPAQRQRLPCYVLAVQCPKGSVWVDVAWNDVEGASFPAQPSPAMRAVQVAMDDLMARLPIDRARVYLTGLSMGGYGCWDLAMREPDRFAAVLAVCGGGDTARAQNLIGLPICVYHGDADRSVPVQRSRLMVHALRSLGLQVDYRELPGVGHDVWRQAYGPGGALDWLFQQDQRQQQRGAWRMPALVPAADDSQYAVGQSAGSRFTLGPTARCCATAAGRDAATVLLDAMSEQQGRSLPLVATDPVPGDLVFTIDQDQSEAVVLTIGDVLAVTARDAQTMQRGAAMAWQLVQAAGVAGVPVGRHVLRTALGGGQIELAAVDGKWSAPALRQLLMLAWCHGTDRIVGHGMQALGWLSEADQAAVRGLSSRAGVALMDVAPAAVATSVAAPSPVDLRDPAGGLLDLEAVLRQPWPQGALPQVVVQVPALSPSETLSALRTRLPAAVERAHAAGRPLHVGGFLSRLGAQLRTHDR